MNANYIARALCYHGQPMQKIWEDERSVEDLRNMGLIQPNYSVYQERQKFFTFQERAKRLKMHQFLARKAIDLYDRHLVANVMEDSLLAQAQDYVVPLAPFEYFLNVKDKGDGGRYRMSALKPGDIICAAVQKIVGSARIVVKPLCTAEPLHFYLADIPIKAALIGSTRNFAPNDFLRCEILEVSADAERLTLGTAPGNQSNATDIKLGLCELTDFPKYYRQIHSLGLGHTPHYEEQLLESLEFQNPNYDVLFQMNGIQPNSSLTLISYLKAGFPEQDYAAELRQKQASQWAFRSVADGIEHFKNGQQVEAFQCLNKALHIDPRNVEGLVARGALYANRGSFLKAIEDFEKALCLNKYHVNARKYMGETLVALGRSYEEDNRLPEAIKAYNDCLHLLPQHEQARQLLDALQRPQVAQMSQLYGDIHTHMPVGGNMGKAAIVAAQTAHSSDDDSSSSGSESESDDQIPTGKPHHHGAGLHFNQPFYAMEPAVSDAQKANEFKLDDDETMSSVRKLLRDANKHKKAKKKGKKKQSRGRSKDKGNPKREQRDMDTVEMLKKIDFNEAYRLMTSARNEAQLKANLQKYIEQSQHFSLKPSESSPPPPPSINMMSNAYDHMGPSTSQYAASVAASSSHEERPPPAPKSNESQKLSFQIKKIDKFGMVRLATPLNRQQSSSHSRSRSRSGTNSPHKRRNERRQPSSHRSGPLRSHSPSPRFRSRRFRSNSRSRTRSPARKRYVPGRYAQLRGGNRYNNFLRDRSRSRSFGRRRPSPFHSRRRTPSPFQPRRRTPSPFQPRRRTPSPFQPHRHSGSTSPKRERNNQRGRGRGRYTWVRTADARTNVDKHADSNGQRRKSKSNDCAGKRPPNAAEKGNDPTIEEIDEMIKEARKERKQGIIESDKNILKKAQSANEK